MRFPYLMIFVCSVCSVKLRNHKAIGHRPALRQTQFLSALHGDNCIHTRFPIGVLAAMGAIDIASEWPALHLFNLFFPTFVHLCVYIFIMYLFTSFSMMFEHLHKHLLWFHMHENARAHTHKHTHFYAHMFIHISG